MLRRCILKETFFVDTRQPKHYQGDVNTNWTPDYSLVAFHDNNEQPTTAETNSSLHYISLSPVFERNLGNNIRYD